MQIEDGIRVRHMINAAESATGFIKGRARPDLDTDVMLQFALARAVEVVGEAASRVFTTAHVTTMSDYRKFESNQHIARTRRRFAICASQSDSSRNTKD